MLIVADLIREKRLTMTDEEEGLFGIDKLNVPRHPYQRSLTLIILHEYRLYI